jgi:putative transcriptional regulator
VIKVKLKELLKEKDKSLLSLAKETGISYNTLHKIKKNDVQSMSFDVLEKICKNLNCSASDLLEVDTES